ncbi:MAG: GNAT family N-acetyltransferase, partial [Acetobacteraceae bacterium]|nr:GNAT family N-acetyltransferase [Acetobacteraceae bacterium]
SASLREQHEQVDSALLFSRVADLGGERIVCGPFCDYCDPLTENGAWQDTVAPVLALHLPVTLRCLRNATPASDPRFTVTGRAAWHGIDLTCGETQLWHGLDGSARQNVRKARRSRVTIREGRTFDDLRLFFDMHCHVRKSKYRLLPQPFAFLEEIYSAFAPQDRIVVLLAEYQGALAAGILFLQWGNTLYYKFNASVDRRGCPNDLLLWEGIRLGQRLGLAQLDLGASDYDQPGLLRYKRKYATEEREIVRLRWEPPGYADPRPAQARQTLSQMTRLLTEPGVPDAVTRAAGEAFYGLFC